jgi:hypothetical protein
MAPIFSGAFASCLDRVGFLLALLFYHGDCNDVFLRNVSYLSPKIIAQCCQFYMDCKRAAKREDYVCLITLLEAQVHVSTQILYLHCPPETDIATEKLKRYKSPVIIVQYNGSKQDLKEYDLR